MAYRIQRTGDITPENRFVMQESSGRTLWQTICALSIALLGVGTALAEARLNMTKGVTTLSEQVYNLHMIIFWICVGISALVFGAVIWSVIHHRKSKGAVAQQFHESVWVEILWTVIPFVILIAMAIPATRTLIAMEDTSESDLTIKVTGFQWKWHYDYINDGLSFFSTLKADSNKARQRGSGIDPSTVENYLLDVDHPLVIPTKKKVRFLITSSDVIHAWWVPAFGWKQDAIPGFFTQGWAKVDQPGTYRGQCAELCGRDHGFMPIVVVAKDEADYQQWLVQAKSTHASTSTGAEGEWTMDKVMTQGEQVYNNNCAACHQADGSGVPGVFKGLAGSAVVKGPVEAHIKTVLQGRPGTAMPAFGPNLSDADLAAVITYERNAWTHKTGDVVAPSQIKALRQQ